MADQAGRAWEGWRRDMQALGGELHDHYKGKGKKGVAVNQAMKQLAKAADTFFVALEATVSDPKVQREAKKASRSLGKALKVTAVEVKRKARPAVGKMKKQAPRVAAQMKKDWQALRKK